MSKADIRVIKNTRLSTIIQNNTPYRVQSNVFRVTDTKCNTPKPTTESSPENTLTLCQLHIAVNNNDITVTKSANLPVYFQLFTASWKAVYSCMQSCGNSHEINNLKKGIYRIITYNRRRKVVCSETIRIGSNNSRFVEDTQGRSTRSSTISSRSVGSNIFPNPAQQVAYLNLKNYMGRQASIVIYNNIGQIIQQIPTFEVTESVITLPAQDLTAGIYHVQIVLDDTTMKTHKMIIQ